MAETIQIIALRILPTAVRGRSTEGEALTYRRSLAGIVPGACLTVTPERRWTFRRTEMIGGVLCHAGFSLGALTAAGFAAPLTTTDERVRAALAEMSAGQWLEARGLLLDALEEEPGGIVAHAAMGDLLAELEHRRDALCHYTAAIRLGLAAPDRPGALLRALTGRARIHAAEGRDDLAARDTDQRDRLAV